MSKRKLRNSGVTTDVTLDPAKTYKYSSTGAIVEATSVGDNDIVISGSKSSLRRIADLERNLSIIAARTQTEDGAGTGDGSGTVDKANRLATSRTITLGGDLSGSVGFDGSSNVTLSATIAANSVVLGTDTTGNYMANVTAGTGISVSHTQGEGSTATISLNASTSNVSEGTNLYYTDARARNAIAVTVGGSSAYNSTTGALTLPSKVSHLTNDSGFYASGSNVSFGTGSFSGAVSTGALTVTGAITATGEVTAYFSDLRLKTNIVPVADALEKVEAINGVTFDPNEAALALGVAPGKQMGVIAQEIEAVAPELVTDSAFAGYKTVRYDKLTALLIEAVKELSAKVKTLEAQLGNTKPTL